MVGSKEWRSDVGLWCHPFSVRDGRRTQYRLSSCT